MFYATEDGYLGKKVENKFVGYFAEGDIFFLLSIEGASQEEGQKLLDGCKLNILKEKISSLSQFETLVGGLILSLNLPAHTSLSTGCKHEDVLFIKTVGNGQVYYRRGKDFDLLMSGDKSASGFIKEFDCVVYTTTKVKDIIGETKDLQIFVDMFTPKDIVEKLKNEQYGDEDQNFGILFVEFTSTPSRKDIESVSTIPSSEPQPLDYELTGSRTENKDDETLPEATVQTPEKAKNVNNAFLDKIDSLKSKKLSLIIVALIFLILIWSVVFGYQRRQYQKLQENIKLTQESIDKKLSQADDVALLNLDQSLKYIFESNQELTELRKVANGKETDKIETIQKKIDETKATIVKKEDKNSREFYDLTLDNKSAKGDKWSLEGEFAAILDSINKKVYVLSLEKKSLQKYTSPDLTGANLISIYDDVIYFFDPKKGVFKFSSETKAKNIIPYDTEWKNIKDMEVYNGNIYLLDAKKGDIYKYLVAESGFSDKRSYFQEGSTFDISEAQDFAIDSAIYLANTNSVSKFASGVSEKFKTSYPDKNINLNGIFTNPDLSQVYVLDKYKSSIFVLGKEGEYISQIQSSVLKNSIGILVYKNNIYSLTGNKISAISLE